MFFVDLAVPRDIDPAVNELDNAFVYDIDDLERVVASNRKEREREAGWAEKIVEEEVERTMRRLAAKELAPTILALEQRLEEIRAAEIERYRGPARARLSLINRPPLMHLREESSTRSCMGRLPKSKSGAARAILSMALSSSLCVESLV